MQTALTSPYFDHFVDFEWDRWKDQEYRKTFIQRLMLRLGKFEWLKCRLPTASFPYHYDVYHLAVVHGLKSSNAVAFQQAWSKQKEVFEAKKLNIETYESRDWISIATFDKCAAHLIRDSAVCEKLAQLASTEPLGPNGQWLFSERERTLPKACNDFVVENTSSAPAPPPRHFVSQETIVVHAQAPNSMSNEARFNQLRITNEASPDLAESSWMIPECKKLEHVRLLRSIGHERGNYIGQVGPCEFKFGLTEKDFGARTDQHTRDFDKFCLVWAQHCFNSTRAEALFKKDPRIVPRLIKKTTAKNRHREIIQIDAMCTEATIKDIYSSYVHQVNEQEKAKFEATETVATSKSVFSPSAPVSTTTSTSTMVNLDHIALEREKLAFEKEKWKAEIALRQEEIALQRKQMEYQSTAADAATILSRLKQYTSPVNDSTISQGVKIQGSKTIGQVSPITNLVLRQFSNIYQTQQGCLDLRLNRKHLIDAIDNGTIYRGYKWIKL